MLFAVSPLRQTAGARMSKAERFVDNAVLGFGERAGAGAERGVPDMKSPFECRQFAEQCRAMANGLSGERRREVLNMADIWEALARDGENAGKNRAGDDAGLERQKASGR